MSTINFLGDNPVTIALGPEVKEIKFLFNDGTSATVAEGKTSNLTGELTQATVVNNDGTSPSFKVTAGYTFPKTASATAKFSAAKSTISVTGAKGLGGELSLIAG